MKGLKMFTINGEMEREPALTIMLNKEGVAEFSDVKSHPMQDHLTKRGVRYKGKFMKPEDGEEFLIAICKGFLGSRVRADAIE